jgi:transposase
VWEWENRLKAKGKDAWRDEMQPGRPMKLAQVQKKMLVKILLRGARRYGYNSELWTLKRIAKVIKKEFNVTYNITHVWRVLQDFGFSAQVPLKQSGDR